MLTNKKLLENIRSTATSVGSRDYDEDRSLNPSATLKFAPSVYDFAHVHDSSPTTNAARNSSPHDSDLHNSCTDS